MAGVTVVQVAFQMYIRASGVTYFQNAALALMGRAPGSCLIQTLPFGGGEFIYPTGLWFCLSTEGFWLGWEFRQGWEGKNKLFFFPLGVRKRREPAVSACQRLKMAVLAPIPEREVSFQGPRAFSTFPQDAQGLLLQGSVLQEKNYRRSSRTLVKLFRTQ